MTHPVCFDGRMTESGYPPDLTTPQWELLQPLLPTAKGGARPPADRRRVFNGRLYLTRAGCAWRRRPHDFGPWQTMYGYLRNWKRTHHWKILHDTRRDYVRVEAGQRTQPTAAMLDSQTVRSADHAGPRGYDGAKKSRGASDIFWWTPCGGGSGSPRPRWPSARARAGYWGRRGAGLAGLRCLWADPGYNGPELVAWCRPTAQPAPSAWRWCRGSKTSAALSCLPHDGLWSARLAGS